MQEDMQELQLLVAAGAIHKESAERLEYLIGILSQSQAFTHFGERQYPQICEAVRLALTARHLSTLRAAITHGTEAADKIGRKLVWLTGTLVALTLILAVDVVWRMVEAWSLAH